MESHLDQTGVDRTTQGLGLSSCHSLLAEAACASRASPRTCRGADRGLIGASAERGIRGGHGGGGEGGPTGTSATADRRACTSASVSGRHSRGGIGPTWTSATVDR